jgi:SNF2 family DNA or RNA helicase
VTAGIFGELTSDGRHVIIMASGDDHELDQAAAALRHLTPLFSKTDPPGALRGPCTWAAVVQLASTFSGSLGQWVPGPRLAAWTRAEALWRTISASAAETAKDLVPAAKVVQIATEPQPAANAAQTAKYFVPEGLTARPYQLAAARMIGTAGKFLIFDEAGAGKTCSAILGLKMRQVTHDIFPLVIVVPSWDVGDVWARHIATWAPEWPEPAMYGGTKRATGPEILVTTYATATLDAADMQGPLARLRARAVVADEVHYIRNVQARRTSAVQRIASRAGTFVGLSGTPITRDTGDVFPTLQAMEPGSWPNRDRFVKRYCLTEDTGYEEKVEGLNPLSEPELRTVLLGQYRRVAKADVLSQLPPKVYSVRRVELPPEWRRAYDGMAAEMLAELPDDSELPVMSVLAQLTRLSQLASSACDVEVTMEQDPVTGEARKRYDVTLRAPSWKADALLGTLAERKGQQVAVFGVSRQLVEIAGQACTGAGYRCGFITGGQGKAARKAGISAFQAGELDVILATAGAGSLGITLTAAGTAVMLQRSWELDKAIQVEDRLHRLDDIVLRHDAIEIIDIVAKDTVDDRVRTLLRVKGGHLGAWVQDARVVRELLGGLKLWQERQ